MGTAGEAFCSWWGTETGRVHLEAADSPEPVESRLSCLLLEPEP